MSGVGILTLSTVIVKVIGLIYKIPMLRLITSVGMGYFNSAYEIYAAFCVIATSGLPVAISLLVSSTQNECRRKRIFSIGLTTFFLLGVACMALMIGLSHPFADFLKSPKTHTSLLCISPAIFFICLSSAARGYFQGTGQMKQTAISQVIEAAGKLIFGLVMAYIGLVLGLEVQGIAALAVLGLTIAEAASAIYLFLSIKRHGARIECSQSDGEGKKIFASLMRTALPLTLSASALGIAKLIDMTMIFRRLSSLGYGDEIINSVYGSYTTLCLPLFSLAPALVSAISLPLVPAISSARAAGDTAGQNDVASRAFRLTAIISAPIGAGLALFPKNILELIFSGEDEAIGVAYPVLSILGLCVLMSCLITLQSAVLSAYERSGLPLLSMLCGSTLKIIICYVLVGDPDINIYGIAIGTFFCDFCISLINMYFISRHTPLVLKLSEVLAKPYFCGITSCVAAFLILSFMKDKIYVADGRIYTLFAVATAAVIYLVLLFATHTLDRQEIMTLISKKHKHKMKE